MTKIVPLAAALLLSLPFAAPAAAPQRPQSEPARARANLASYISNDDYPEEALRNEEEGTVHFRLDVGSDGKPTGCSVITSSGSSALDSTTCRLMVERPRFQPARDERGRAVPDQVTSRISWRIMEHPAQPRIEAMLGLWRSCIEGETAKLVVSDLSAEEVAKRSFGPCTALEAQLGREVGEDAGRTLRPLLTESSKAAVERYRKELNSPAAGDTDVEPSPAPPEEPTKL